MKHILTLMMLVLIAASCTERSDINAVLDHADSIMVAHPDSALSLLDSIGAEKETFPHSQLMRYELLHADAQNKAYVDFTTDSVMVKVAEYYDAHGTPSEKMRAYYLLGCTYRDLHEAPMTLQCYQTAVEKADTTSNDCDFFTAMCIYGQMAELYHKQLLAKEELKAWDKYSICASKADNKYNEIRGIELKCAAYTLLCDTDAILYVKKKAHDLYLNNNMPQAAAASFGVLVRLYTSMGKFEKADSAMHVFETESGIFDENGNIERGREHYYCDKGFFYHKTGNLALAKAYYQKGISKGNFLRALEGMRDVYAEQKMYDSAQFYMDRYIDELDRLEAIRQTQTIQQMNSMYDYSRNQKLAAEKEKEANRVKQILVFVLFGIVIAVCMTYYIYKNVRARTIARVNSLVLELSLAKQALERAEIEKQSLYTEQDIQAKDEEIYFLRKNIKDKEEKLAKIKANVVEDSFFDSAVYKMFCHKTKINKHWQAVTEEEWATMFSEFNKYFSTFIYSINAKSQLTDDQMKICILCRLNFAEADMVRLMDVDSQRINRIKAQINKKLFGIEGAKTMRENLKTLE